MKMAGKEGAMKCLECMTEFSQRGHGNRQARKALPLCRHKVCSGTEGHKGNDSNKSERPKKLPHFQQRGGGSAVVVGTPPVCTDTRNVWGHVDMGLPFVGAGGSPNPR